MQKKTINEMNEKKTGFFINPMNMHIIVSNFGLDKKKHILKENSKKKNATKLILLPP